MVLNMLIKMFFAVAPYVVGGFLVAGAIHLWVPQDVLRRHLGRRGFVPLLKAVGIGSVLPICSCGALPLGVGLYKSGAAVGTILSFMTSTPILSPALVLIAFKMLGVKLTVTLLVTALAGSFLIGWVGNIILPDKRQVPDEQAIRQHTSSRQNQTVPTFWKWIHWSLFEMGAHVSVDMVIGLGLATVVMAFLPLDFIAQWLGRQHLTSLIFILVLSLPIYSCSVPSVPVMQSLLLLGMTPGAAVVYLMAGPATNMGELNAIRTNMGGKVAVYYALALMVVALTAGLITDHFVYPDYHYAAASMQNKLVVQQCCVPVLYNEKSIYKVNFSDVSLLEWGSGAILALLIAVGVTGKLRDLLVNPCQSCLWKEYARDHQCAQQCHVRRKHEWFVRLKRCIIKD
jgi:uncharacterized membrane protein YraQ (UPF0718 family)